MVVGCQTHFQIFDLRLRRLLKKNLLSQDGAYTQIRLPGYLVTNINFPDTPKRPLNALFFSLGANFLVSVPFGFKKKYFIFSFFAHFAPHGAGSRPPYGHQEVNMSKPSIQRALI